MSRRVLTDMAVLVTFLLGNGLPSVAYTKFTCPTTQPAVLTFKPAGAFAGNEAHLFGSEKLFTVFPGNWHTTQRSWRGYKVPKIVWGSNVFDPSGEPEECTLTISGRRLDASSGPLRFDVAHTAVMDRGAFITSSFYVPTLGCWEVLGHFHGAHLNVVVDLK